MKYFGFIKEHDNISKALSIKDLIDNSLTENKNRQTIIDYLKKGELCVPFMGCVEDANDPKFNTDAYDDDDFIAYMAINTDGTWYWPQYIIAYLERYPGMKINEDFEKHVLKNVSKKIKLSEEDISKLEKEYLQKGGFKKEN